MKHATSRLGLAIAVLGLIGGAAGRAGAALTLTLAGQNQGLSLSTFTSGFPNTGINGIGPLGTAFANDGAVLVSDPDIGKIYRFGTDTDGQVATPALITADFGGAAPNDMAQIGGKIYMTRQSTGDLVQLNQDGTFNQVTVSGMPAATGLVANPFTGHLFLSTVEQGVIFDVDPVAKTKTTFVNFAADGLSLSPDGSILYAAGKNGHLIGFNTTTKAQVFDAGVLNSLDGTAVGTGPIFGGLIFANTNDGRLIEINTTTLAQTLIASGGSRGDYVSIDPTNDTLLIIQTDSILRLKGASFLTTPEPSTILMACFAVPMVALVARRRRGKALRRSPLTSSRAADVSDAAT
jgi:hypothetical protein